MKSWIGRTQETHDEIAPGTARRAWALLDLPGAPPPILPAYFAALYFWDVSPQAALGPDGHPRTGDFLPPVALPRRMLAGRRLRFPGGALPLGAPATRRSEITAITPRQGRSGSMVFVTITHSVECMGEVAAIEEQDVVYREAMGGPSAATPAPDNAVWAETLTPNPTMLFRYSAITFNGHRIHYDADYARDAEGYPGLVVNGGLTILLLLRAALRENPGGILAGYEARTMRPLFCGHPLTLAAAAAQGATQIAWAADADGAMALALKLFWA